MALLGHHMFLLVALVDKPVQLSRLPLHTVSTSDEAFDGKVAVDRSHHSPADVGSGSGGKDGGSPVQGGEGAGEDSGEDSDVDVHAVRFGKTQPPRPPPNFDRQTAVIIGSKCLCG